MNDKNISENSNEDNNIDESEIQIPKVTDEYFEKNDKKEEENQNKEIKEKFEDKDVSKNELLDFVKRILWNIFSLFAFIMWYVLKYLKLSKINLLKIFFLFVFSFMLVIVNISNNDHVNSFNPLCSEWEKKVFHFDLNWKLVSTNSKSDDFIKSCMPKFDLLAKYSDKSKQSITYYFHTDIYFPFKWISILSNTETPSEKINITNQRKNVPENFYEDDIMVLSEFYLVNNYWYKLVIDPIIFLINFLLVFFIYYFVVIFRCK